LIPSQRNIVIPTFPPTFVAPPPLINTTATTTSSSVNTQTMSNVTTTTDSLRLAAEVLFKSNSVHRSPSNQFICSNCHRTVKSCDVSVQTSLDDDTDHNTTSRLRLVSLTSSDDGLSGDGAWFSLDSPRPRIATQEYQMGNTRPTVHDKGYDELSSRSIPRMHHV
jgi:hypothetical protein